MAGTDRSKQQQPEESATPAVVLVAPQLGMNIGMVARAMMNCGLSDLRLVKPRDGWPNPEAEAPAAGAGIVLERTRVFDSLADAIADLQYAYATTARPRGIIKEVFTPRAAVSDLRARLARSQRCALVFGAERTGLEAEDIALCDALINVPLNPGFSSLNLAQAVLLVGYEWFQSGDDTPVVTRQTGVTPPADKRELQAFYERLESELESVNFFWPVDKGPAMKRNLRNLFNRLEPTEQDIRTLHGVVSALINARRRRGKG
ncbi:MAG: RNA methyltransferase [Limibacillus sp.]